LTEGVSFGLKPLGAKVKRFGRVNNLDYWSLITEQRSISTQISGEEGNLHPLLGGMLNWLKASLSRTASAQNFLGFTQKDGAMS
jgi:hypothetical protein